jgi:hypothetical protein
MAGGISEVGFHFDLEGNLWGVGRNEDGDDSGIQTAAKHGVHSFIFVT